MERSYNVFVDNGLYVAAHHLEKEVEEITVEDLRSSTDYFAELVFSLIVSPKYSKMASMGFNNSAYTQPAYKNNRLEKIKEQFNMLFENVGHDEVCTICGKRHVKFSDSNLDFIKSLSRALMPGLPANVFFNYSNNLQLINVCPICVYLSMISIMNMRKTGDTLTIFNSDDVLFMENYTYYMQDQVTSDMLQDAPESKDKTNSYRQIVDTIKWLATQENIYNKGYINAVSFYNGQVPKYSDSFISEANLKLIKKLTTHGLLNEFEQCGLFNAVIKDNLEYTYLYYLIDIKTYQLKCNVALLNLLNKEITYMDKETLNLISEICPKVSSITNKGISKLKETFKYADYEALLVKWQEDYAVATNELLFTNNEQMSAICNPFKWKSIKNYMISELIIINNSSAIKEENTK